MNAWKKMRFKLTVRLIPRRVLCALTGGHRRRWQEKSPVIIDGPIDLPPRERGWAVLGFSKQCSLCYTIKDVGYSFDEAVAAVREEIERDEAE